jgi:hypothetical protein
MTKRKIWKKILMVVAIVFSIFIIAGSIASYMFINLWPWELLLNRLTEAQIEQRLPALKRNYPNVIKGNWEPSPFHMSKLMGQEVDNLKKLGVNTVSVNVEYRFKKDGSFYVSNEQLIKSNIIKAKENGFAVMVVPSFMPMGDPVLKNQGVSITEQEFKEASTQAALKWAEIAEKYKAEFFAPQNEFDVLIDVNFADDEEVFVITSKWHRNILPSLRKRFSGKIIAKLGRCLPDMDVTGYDYVGITISHQEKGLNQFRKDIKQQYLGLSQAASKSGCEWLVSEAWMPYGGPFYPQRTNREGKSLDELQDEYFKIAAEEYLKFKQNKPSGFIFIAWIMPGEAIKNRPAEKVIENFFRKL